MIFAKIRLAAWNILLLLGLLLAQQRSEYDMTDPVERVRAYTRWQEFDYVTWTIDALKKKWEQSSINVWRYMNEDQQRDAVLAYLDLIDRFNQVENEITSIYANPDITDKTLAAADLLTIRSQLEFNIQRQAALAESVLQRQISVVLAEMGLRC